MLNYTKNIVGEKFVKRLIFDDVAAMNWKRNLLTAIPSKLNSIQ